MTSIRECEPLPTTDGDNVDLQNTLHWSSIKPYAKGPMVGSCGFKFLQRFRDLGDEWHPTRAIHDIYRSPHGGHVNMLIKLYKSDFIGSMLIKATLDVKTSQGLMPQRVLTRVWKLLPRGWLYLANWEKTPEEWKAWAINRVTNYCDKRDIPYQLIVSNDGRTDEIWITSITYRNETEIRVFPISDFIDRAETWRDLYRIGYYYRSDDVVSKVDAAIHEECRVIVEGWLEKHPEAVSEIQTGIGLLKIEGTYRYNSYTLDGTKVCVMPDKSVHPADYYVCRLAWMNYDLDRLLILIAREYTMKDCPLCHFKQSKYSPFNGAWKYCPGCGTLIDELARIVFNWSPVLEAQR